MASSQPNFIDLCRSLPPETQSHIFAKHILPLLDSLAIPEDTRQTLIDGIAQTKAHWDNYPSPDFGKRKEEIAEMLLRLKQHTKLNVPSDGVMGQNEMLVEVMYAMLEWTKELWVVGVEFGQHLESVHESLTFLACTAEQINSPSISNCTCIIPSIKVRQEFIRSDGEIIEHFTGPADQIVVSSILYVWRDLFLAQLTRPENKSETSSFATARLPAMLRDILAVRDFSISTLFRMLDPSGLDEGDSDGDDEDEDFDDEDDYEDCTTDEDPDDMPPLIDLDNPSSMEPESLTSTGRLDSKESSKDIANKSADKDGEQETKSEKGEEEEEEEGKDGSESEEEDVEEVSELTLALDDELDERENQIPRLTKLVYSFATATFKLRPTHKAFAVLVAEGAHVTKDLVEHLATMPHTPDTFREAVHILIKEKATVQLTKMVPRNMHFGARVAPSMQDIAMYYSQRQSTRSLAAPIIMKQMEAMFQDMVLEVEFAFNGVCDPAKKAELSVIAKIPQAERGPAIKLWVEEVVTPPAESLSDEAQANTADATNLDPFGMLAALSASLGFAGPEPISGPSAPLYYDPVEALDPEPGDLDFAPMMARYRPEFSILYETWMSTMREVGRVDKAAANLGPKLYHQLAQIAPYVSNKVIIAEMKSRCAAERQDYIRIILTQLHAFASSQIKVITAAKKAAAQKKGKTSTSNANQASSSSSQTNTAGLRDFVSAPAPTPPPTSSPSSPTPTSSTHAAPHGMFPLPPDISNMMMSFMGLTVPGAFFAGGAPPTQDPAWDDVD